MVHLYSVFPIQHAQRRFTMISGLEAYIQAVYDLNQDDDDDDDDDDDRNREGFPLSQIIRGHFMHN